MSRFWITHARNLPAYHVTFSVCLFFLLLTVIVICNSLFLNSITSIEIYRKESFTGHWIPDMNGSIVESRKTVSVWVENNALSKQLVSVVWIMNCVRKLKANIFLWICFEYIFLLCLGQKIPHNFYVFTISPSLFRLFLHLLNTSCFRCFFGSLFLFQMKVCLISLYLLILLILVRAFCSIDCRIL